MSTPTRVALAGAGAFGTKHLDAIRLIDGVEVVSVVGREFDKTKAVAAKYGIGHVATDLADSLALKEVDAVILCTPTPMHAAQAIACLEAGKHVQVEIPLADSLKDAEQVMRVQKKTGKVAMVGHTRRFNPSHQWVRKKIQAGQFSIQQMDVQTYFFRRTNMNALGQPRSWTDHLLWHHAAHTVDLFAYQTGGDIVAANAIQGPIHPALGIAMDMSIQLKSSTGAICTLSLSFNNDGPLGTFFRYIGDTGTYIARYDDLFNGKDEKIDVSKVDVSLNGIELQDREFFAAIREGRDPNASVAQVLPCYRTLARLERQLGVTTMAPDARKPDIPGTTLFDGAMARKGYALNKMCYSFNSAANRDAFLRDEDAYCAKFGLNEAQRTAVRNRNVLELIAAGGNIYYLAKLAGIFHLDVQDIGAQQTGMSKDDFKAMLVAAGR